MVLKVLSPLRRSVRALRRNFSPRALILLYHRVGDPGCDPWELAVAPQHFDEHLAVLRAQPRPIHFRELANATRNGDVPPGALVVTFDDGYADNLLNAKPLLEKHDVPATVFVTTGGLDSAEEFWWDELERIVLSEGPVPERLQLRIGGQIHSWELGGDANHNALPGQHRMWKAWQKEAPTARHGMYRAIWQLLRPLPDGERNDVREQLRAWAVAAPPTRSTHRALSRSEVAQLAASGLVDVGSHTVSHPQLSLLPIESQRTEIVRSQHDLQSILGRPVTSFAYPYGDYADETVGVLRHAGFQAAGTTGRGCVTARSDPYRFPRLHVRDVDGETFARTLREWLQSE